MLRAITAFFQAATAYLERWHLWKEYDLTIQINSLDEEIISLADSDSPDAVLRVETLNRKRGELRSLRSSIRNAGKG